MSVTLHTPDEWSTQLGRRTTKAWSLFREGCLTCEYSRRSPEVLQPGDDTLQCVRYPPNMASVTAAGAQQLQYLFRKRDDWCGEYRREGRPNE